MENWFEGGEEEWWKWKQETSGNCSRKGASLQGTQVRALEERNELEVAPSIVLFLPLPPRLFGKATIKKCISCRGIIWISVFWPQSSCFPNTGNALPGDSSAWSLTCSLQRSVKVQTPRCAPSLGWGITLTIGQNFATIPTFPVVGVEGSTRVDEEYLKRWQDLVKCHDPLLGCNQVVFFPLFSKLIQHSKWVQRDLVEGPFMWIETHKLQFAELQEGGELYTTSSHLAPPWRVWKGEKTLGTAPKWALGFLHQTQWRTIGRNNRIWKQRKWPEVAAVDAMGMKAKPYKSRTKELGSPLDSRT